MTDLEAGLRFQFQDESRNGRDASAISVLMSRTSRRHRRSIPGTASRSADAHAHGARLLTSLRGDIQRQRLGYTEALDHPIDRITGLRDWAAWVDVLRTCYALRDDYERLAAAAFARHIASMISPPPLDAQSASDR